MPEQVGKHYVLADAEPRKGGLSTVYKGIDMRDLTQVAVKFIDRPSDEMSRKVFERETRALRGLSHPNIVRIRDDGIAENGTPYLVLDWVDQNLKDLLKARPWQGWGDLYDMIARPLVDGLAHIHLKQLEHRDIKPGNILVDAAGAPLLADFGIARIRVDEPHSELTVQQFRSGPYAPPERDGVIKYVRDVYSVGVVLLQCLTESKITDFREVKAALEAVKVPPEVRAVLEACVNPQPGERLANGSVLADELVRVTRQRVALQAQSHYSVWLDLTRTAQVHLAGEPVDRSRAFTKLLADLSGYVSAEYGRDKETGQRDRRTINLAGAEHRYTLRLDSQVGTSRFTVIAAADAELDVLEGTRRRGLALPPIFSWTVDRPANATQSDNAREMLIELLDEFYERKDHPEIESPDQDGDDVFDVWFRVLEAREELSRGELQPLAYKGIQATGRRTLFTLTEVPELDLVGMSWEIKDQHSGRSFGRGEVIEQEGDRITLLSSRPLIGPPPVASLVPFNAPSAIALSRQRNAVTAIRNGTTPNPDLRTVLVSPATNAQPVAQDVSEWFADLDPAKKEAVQLALGTQDVLVIHGPPGTGKTRFIAETVSQLLKKQPDVRVLIASQTNVAVDNAVERLHEAGVRSLVRLAGPDESNVQPQVRGLLLDKQAGRWADSVRTRAKANVALHAADLGVEEEHLKAALTLQELVAVSEDLGLLQERLKAFQTTRTESSDLATAIEESDPVEQLQSRMGLLTDQHDSLVQEAQALLAGALTISAEIGCDDARDAIDVLLGTSPAGRELLQRLKLQAAWLERIGTEDSLTPIFLAGTSVLAGTCIGFLRRKAVSELQFDLCIVDEASKATLTEALVPMSRARRWILVGDTHQLPPSDEELLRATDLLSEHGISKDNVTETLFQRLVDRLPAHSQLTLDEQYRMIRPIGDLISECFYGGDLRSPRTEGLSGYEKVMGGAVTWIDTTPLGDRRREQGTTSYANRAEAQLVLKQLETVDQAIGYGIIKLPKDSDQLEVLAIAPYKAQVEELRRRLAPKSFRYLVPTAMSVDAVQGRESDLAIVSLTRSNPQGKLGFLGAEYWRRINVALSRARFGLMIIGDAGFIRGTNGALRTVLKYVEQHPADCEMRLVGND